METKEDEAPTSSSSQAEQSTAGTGEKPATQRPPVTSVPPRFTTQPPKSSGWSIRPGGSAEGPLGLVDAQLRESDVPVSVANNEPVGDYARASLDPGASISDLYAVGNFTDAMEEAERRLAKNPNDEDARHYAEECRRTLTRMYMARLGPVGGRLQIAVASRDIRWMSLDHRAGFILSLVDGASTVSDLLDVCSMPHLDALRILAELKAKGVVEVLPP